MAEINAPGRGDQEGRGCCLHALGPGEPVQAGPVGTRPGIHSATTLRSLFGACIIDCAYRYANPVIGVVQKHAFTAIPHIGDVH